MGTFDSQREKLKKVSRVENCEKVPVETLTIKILGRAVESEEFSGRRSICAGSRDSVSLCRIISALFWTQRRTSKDVFKGDSRIRC